MQMSLPLSPEPEVVTACKREGRVLGTYVTADTSPKGFQTTAVAELALELDGIVGSRHRGWVGKADARVPYLKRGTPMRNGRHVSLVSAEDLSRVAAVLGTEHVEPEWLGANLLLDSLPNFSFLPRGTRLICEGGAILVVEAQNAPCRIAGAAISGHVGRQEIELDFPRLATRMRGVVATVEHPGIVRPGASVTARIPEQWIYR